MSTAVLPDSGESGSGLRCAVAAPAFLGLTSPDRYLWPGGGGGLGRRQQEISANFERLVLGCIDADFCKLVNTLWNTDPVRKLLTRSPRFTYFWQFAPLRPQKVSATFVQNVTPVIFVLTNHDFQQMLLFFLIYLGDFVFGISKHFKSF